jgi:hypothetical protein
MQVARSLPRLTKFPCQHCDMLLYRIITLIGAGWLAVIELCSRFLEDWRFFSRSCAKSKSRHLEELEYELERSREDRLLRNRVIGIMVFDCRSNQSTELRVKVRKKQSCIQRFFGTCTILRAQMWVYLRADDGTCFMTSINPLRIPVGMHG